MDRITHTQKTGHSQQSGKWQGKERITGGRASIRRAIYMPALVAIRFNRDLHDKYQPLKRSHQHVAFGAVVEDDAQARISSALVGQGLFAHLGDICLLTALPSYFHLVCCSLFEAGHAVISRA
ncbi:transposase [Pseudogemmobacter faecipullorum]|uniref:transposase n=1 Tax=Pseudogemmobacter faecipullorum TaxID=2755041 RepID=UPI003F490A63